MSKFLNSDSRKIAYVSLAVNPNGYDLEKTRQYCMDLPFEVDLFAEEIHPNSKDRPLFQEVLERIEEEDVSLLIVPNRYHLGGDRPDQMAYLTRFLGCCGVALVFTDEVDLSYDEFSGREFPNSVLNPF